MEEGERDDGGSEPQSGVDGGPSCPSPSNVQMLQISGFAEKFAASVLKESVQESGVEPIWAITCSSDCHNHTKAIPGEEGDKSLATMQLCWTPESPSLLSSPSQPPGKSHCRHHTENTEETSAQTINSSIEDNPTKCSIANIDINCQNAQNCQVTSDGKSIESSLNYNLESTENEHFPGKRDEGTKSPDFAANRLQEGTKSPDSTAERLHESTKSPNAAANRHTVADCQISDHPTTHGEGCPKDSSTLASAKEYLQELSSTGRRLSKEKMSLSDPSEIIAQSAEHLAVDHFQTQENSCTSSRLRKGMSVNDVTCGEVIEGIAAKEQLSSGDLCPKNSKRVGFLRQLGRGLRRNRDEQGGEPGRGKKGLRSFRKTLSSLFSLKGRWREEGEEECGRGKRPTSAPVVGLFKLPARRGKNVPPSKRALPPVPSVDSLPTVSVDPPRTPDPLAPILDQSAEIREMDDVDWPVVSEHSPEQGSREGEPTNQMKFAASIEKVKDQGWYWGPISGEAAEKILAKEPDGSFVVRDSSDHHYIFSLTFKLNGFVRHVRIEHDQGNFSFGSFTKFKSNTIVDFIENAVEHSRSGRYLFFLHRRPVLGPMRVQLLHPVSRYKEVQSLQHMCRYVIVKHVRRDLLSQLPVPTRMKQYLNTPFYYSEQVAEEAEDNPNMHAIDQHDAFCQVEPAVEQDLEASGDGVSMDNDRLLNCADSVSHTVPNSELDNSLETGDFFVSPSTSAMPDNIQTQLSSSSVVDTLAGTSQVNLQSSRDSNQAVLTLVQGNTQNVTDSNFQNQMSETCSDRGQQDEVMSTLTDIGDLSSERTDI